MLEIVNAIILKLDMTHWIRKTAAMYVSSLADFSCSWFEDVIEYNVKKCMCFFLNLFKFD